MTKITICAQTEKELKETVERLHEEDYQFKTTGAWYLSWHAADVQIFGGE